MQRRTRIILSVVGAAAAIPVAVGMVQGAIQATHTAAASTPSRTAAISLPAIPTPVSTRPSPQPSTAAPATSKPATTPRVTTAPPATTTPAAACTLPDTQDVLVRYIVPGLQANAQELGEVFLAQCESTLDYIAQTAPTGDGYCTQVAWVADNPGYNPDAVPAPPLKKVIEAIGGSC